MLRGLQHPSPNIPEWVFDSSKEPPTFSVKKFFGIERQRFEVCHPDNPRLQGGFEGLFQGLLYFQSRLGKKLIVVLFPDEFQVNDELYHSIKASDPDYSSYQRDYPQERIVAYCQEQGLRCVDMLPALREGHKKDRTYHLRDTHFNAYGNRIVGTELAQTIRMYLNTSKSSY